MIAINHHRNYGVDFLRIISMFFVIILHVLEHGGITRSLTPLTTNYYLCWFIEIGCYCAVNCYALISGYVGYSAQYKSANLMELYCQTAFWGTLITVIFQLISPKQVVLRDLFKAFFPFAYDTYWFFSCYFCIFFFIPFFNHLIQSLEKSKCTALIFVSITLFSIMPTVFNNSIFQINNGFSALWLGTLYLIGAYIKKYQPFKQYKSYLFLVSYFLIISITWLSKIGVEYCEKNFGFKLYDSSLLISYVSPTVLLSGIALLLFFSNIHLHNILKTIISFFTPLVFGVYLIHDNLLVRNLVIYDRFSKYASYHPMKLIFAIFITTLFIWILCSMLEFIRYKTFRFLKIKQYCLRLENYIVTKWNSHF